MSGSNFNDTDRIAQITSTDVVQIVTMADFPAPSAGVITLDANKSYELMESLSTSDRFVLPTNSTTIFMAGAPGLTSLTYTGTATFFTTTDVGFFVPRNLTIIATSTGTLYDVTGLTNALPFVAAQGCTFIGWTTSLGTLDSLLPFFANCSFVDCGAFTWTDVIDFSMVETTFSNPSGDLSTNFLTIDGTAVITGKFNGCTFTTNANEDALDIDSGIAAGSLIRIHNNSFLGAGKALDAASLDTTEIRVISDANQGLRDGTISAEMFLIGNTQETSIPAAGALVEIALDVNWDSSDVERLIVSNDGSVESIGAKDTRLKIDANINLEPAASSKTLSMRTVLVIPPPITVTFTNATNLINETSTALVDGDTISFRDTVGTLPAEIRADIVYFVVSKLTNSFQVSYTSGGSAIAFTDDGTPVNSYQVTELHGSTPTNAIASGSPRDLIPQASIPAVLNSDSFLVVINNDDAVNITVNSGYQRYFE